MNYRQNIIAKIIHDRTRAKAEFGRETRRVQLCPNCSVDFFPFKLYCLMYEGIVDIRELRKYELLDIYWAYIIFCVESEWNYENPNNYGINSIF